MSRDQLKLVQKLADRQEKEAASLAPLRRVAWRVRRGNSIRSLGIAAIITGLPLVLTVLPPTPANFKRPGNFSELDGIAGRQQKTVQQAELLLEQHRTAWIEAKRRQTAISRLREARASERSKIDEKRQQQLSDALFLTQRSLSAVR